MQTLTCLVHIDASLLSFRFTEATYVEVKYGTEDVSTNAVVYAVEISPSVLQTINNIPDFIRTCEKAANHNAREYWHHKATGERPASNLRPATQQLLSPVTTR